MKEEFPTAPNGMIFAENLPVEPNPIVTPVSNADPQPAIQNSSPESQASEYLPQENEGVKIYVDAAWRSSNVPATVGCVVKRGDLMIDAGSAIIGDAETTSNQAEYAGIILGLGFAKKYSDDSCIVYSDSELAVRQLNGEYAVSSENIKGLYNAAKALMDETKCEIVHIPREKNNEAHAAAAIAMDKLLEERAKAIQDDSNLVSLKEFIRGESYNSNWVTHHIGNICAVPQVIPAISTWITTKPLDVPQAVYNVIVADGYIDSIWPALSVLMGSSLGNISWTASVATTIALFDVIKAIPVLNQMQTQIQS